MTTLDTARPVTGGVDTHLEVNVAAALDRIGGLLGVEQFTTTPAGNRQLLGWLAGFGPVVRVGVEGTGSYGASLARYLRRAGVEVVEVDRPNRQERRRKGKTDTVDAIQAAHAAQGDRQLGQAKHRDGHVEAIRALMVAKRSARSTKVKALNQIRHLGFTAPEEIRRSLQGCPRAIAKQAAAMRPSAHGDPVVFATKTALRTLGRRVLALDQEKNALDGLLGDLVQEVAPDCWSCTGSESTPPPPCWSPPATTPIGCAARRPGPTCAGCRPSRPLRARSPASGSTAAATAKPTRPCGASSSPACDPIPAPRPTWPAASKKADPSPRSSASSNATSPARSTSTFLAKAARQAAGLARRAG